MISLLNGNLIEVHNGEAVIDVSGVGYAVRVPATYMHKNLTQVKLYIDTVVREDSITLFGFETKMEKELFRLLYSVSGVGPKTALAIISFYSVDDIRKVIVNRDVLLLSRVPGIGKKTAERIIVELKDKLGFETSKGDVVSFTGGSVYEELVQALVNFGYKRTDAVNALKPRMDDISNGRPVAEVLRETLRGMM